MLTLLGIVVVVAGFAFRLNPLLVVVAAGLVTGLAAGMSPIVVVSAFGKAFIDNRYVSVVWVVLPVIGLLERYGLQTRARALITRFRTASVGGVLTLYLVARQISAALGLIALGGHAQMVRPLIAPMVEAAAEGVQPDLSESLRDHVKAHAAAVDNIGAFFGEDIFIAFGSILLIKSTLHANGVEVAPFQLSLWAIPTAVIAFGIHAIRLWLLDRRINRGASPAPTVEIGA